jgi:hypothetical protein
VKRREFITLLGGAAVAWPLGARAQQPATPVIGLLRDSTAAGSEFMVDGLRKGLSEAGFVEGRNLTIEYAWTEGRSERLSALAAESLAVPSTRRTLPRQRPPRSQLYSQSTTIRSQPSWLRASTARAAILPAWPIWARNLEQNGWG